MIVETAISLVASMVDIKHCVDLARDVHLARIMRGVITTWDVLRNPLLVWRTFGARCLLRCLSAILLGRSTTFLELAMGKH